MGMKYAFSLKFCKPFVFSSSSMVILFGWETREVEADGKGFKFQITLRLCQTDMCDGRLMLFTNGARDMRRIGNSGASTQPANA